MRTSQLELLLQFTRVARTWFDTLLGVAFQGYHLFKGVDLSNCLHCVRRPAQKGMAANSGQNQPVLTQFALTRAAALSCRRQSTI
jgi:hypothetical protein